MPASLFPGWHKEISYFHQFSTCRIRKWQRIKIHGCQGLIMNDARVLISKRLLLNQVIGELVLRMNLYKNCISLQFLIFQFSNKLVLKTALIARAETYVVTWAFVYLNIEVKERRTPLCLLTLRKQAQVSSFQEYWSDGLYRINARSFEIKIMWIRKVNSRIWFPTMSGFG